MEHEDHVYRTYRRTVGFFIFRNLLSFNLFSLLLHFDSHLYLHLCYYCKRRSHIRNLHLYYHRSSIVVWLTSYITYPHKVTL